MSSHILIMAVLYGETSFSFTVATTAGIWRTWWIVILIFGAITAIIVYFYYYRLKQEIAIERMRSRIATDLHDDIGSTLSGISIFSEMGYNETEGKSPIAAELFRRIGESSLSMLDAMDDIVWAINPENDSLQPLVVRMRDFATGILEAKQIAFTLRMPSDSQDIKLSMNERKNIYLIFKEGIHNLVEHSNCTNSLIGINMNKNILRLYIEDDGEGFDPLTVRNGNGLKNMRRRAESIGASISIESAPRKGTKVAVQLKIT